MKEILNTAFVYFLIVLVSCTSEKRDDKKSTDSIVIQKRISHEFVLTPELTISQIDSTLLIGKWKLDSTGIIVNDVLKKVESDPGGIWSFGPEGKLTIKQFNTMSMDYKFVGNAIETELGEKTKWDFICLTQNRLILTFVISSDKDKITKGIRIFSRKN